MDWKSIATLAAPFAPTVGKILGGLIPVPGGALLGEWAFTALARALGVPATPASVEKAIQAAPEAELRAKLASVEQEAVARWDALARMEEAQAADRTAQSVSINETMRAEVPNVPWWHWRHLLGYVLVLLGVEAVTLLPLVVLGKIPAAEMGAIIGALTPLTTVFAALNGYIAQDTNKLKAVAITGEQPPSMAAAVVGAVKSVVKPAPKVIGKPVGSRD